MASISTPNLRDRRFTVEEMYRMVEAGILGEDDRVELINGRIVQMSPPGPPHASVVNILTAHFTQLGRRAIVSVQNPLRLDRRNQPEPDLMLLKPRDDFYRERHPGPEDVLLLIEVSDTSLREDRAIKSPLFARFGVPECWVIDIEGRCAHVGRQPGKKGYDEVTRLAGDDELGPLAFPEHVIEVGKLFD